MMRRFSRKRRSASEGAKRTIDAKEWLPKILDAGLVDATSLTPAGIADIPDSVAVIGRGERADGSAVLVSFSPRSATEALLAGLAAAQHSDGPDASIFTGMVFIVAPQWPAGARRLLGLLGQAPYNIEPVAATSLSDTRVVVESEPRPPILATGSAQLAARMTSADSRAAFIRAAAALEGLAAKHGGCVRAGADRLELIVLARRVAEIRTEGESAFLEVQLGGRQVTPLSGADLAGAMDGLEGQIRRRLNDRKVREGEEGLRGRVVAQLSTGDELRGLRAWPQPTTDLGEVDAFAVNSSGDPVVVAVREEFGWVSLAGVLEAIAPLSALAPVLFADVGPPLRLGGPRLLLVAERFVAGLDRTLAALTVGFELRTVKEAAGPGLSLLPGASGEGAQETTARRPRRRGGRSGGESKGRGRSRRDEVEASSETETAAAGEESGIVKAREEPGRGDADGERSSRGRRRRRGRRPRSGSEASDEADEASPTAERGGRADEGKRGSRRFEEVSLMDIEDGSKSAGDSESDGGVDSEERTGGKPKRSRRRGRRGASESRDEGEGQKAVAVDDAEETVARVEEEDLVDSDDLEEILARLADEFPDVDESEGSELKYDDDEEDSDGDQVSDAQRLEREKRRRERKKPTTEDVGDEDRPTPRRRSAIVVHADRDSLIAALLLARDIRQIDGIWIYEQSELMTFFRSVATDLRDDMPIFVVGFSPSPARDVVQAAALYRGRIEWFDRHAWPPEDLVALRDSIGADSIRGGEEIDSSLPLVLETCSRRSRFSDKLVDLVTGRFTQHDFERWGRLWWSRFGEIAQKSGDIRADIAPILNGRPSDLAKDAALIPVPTPPEEIAFVASKDFRLVHFGGHMMVIVPVDPGFDIHLTARIARERYGATLSLAHHEGEETFAFTGDEMNGKRPLDYLAVVEHLVSKLEWVEARPDADHVARFHVRDLAANPDRLQEVMGEIAMGRSLLER